jgi:hypothetical protein
MSWFGVEDGLMWFYDQVLPVVRRACRTCAGIWWGPAQRGEFATWRRLTAVVVHGYVGDIAPLVEQSRVAIVPLRFAGGIRMKLLDLFAWGVPAVPPRSGPRVWTLPTAKVASGATIQQRLLPRSSTCCNQTRMERHGGRRRSYLRAGTQAQRLETN